MVAIAALTQTSRPIHLSNARQEDEPQRVGLFPGCFLNWNRAVIDVSSAAANFATGITIPANSLVFSSYAKPSEELEAATAVKFGLGPAGDPDQLGLSAGLTDAAVGGMIDPVLLTSSTTVLINATDTNGGAAGTIGGGTGEEVAVYFAWIEFDVNYIFE